LDGLSAIRKISQLARHMLLDGGWIMFEHGWGQGSASREILQNTNFINVETLQDLAGHDRVTLAEKPA
jgi:release factor glutamine methyltransferase